MKAIHKIVIALDTTVEDIRAVACNAVSTIVRTDGDHNHENNIQLRYPRK